MMAIWALGLNIAAFGFLYLAYSAASRAEAARDKAEALRLQRRIWGTWADYREGGS